MGYSILAGEKRVLPLVKNDSALILSCGADLGFDACGL